MCSSAPYRWLIYSNDSIMEFSNREFSFMETSFPEIFCQGFFFHGKFFSWNFPFHEIKIFPGIFLIMENSFHGICFHSIFFLKFSFMEKKITENSCSRLKPWKSKNGTFSGLVLWHGWDFGQGHKESLNVWVNVVPHTEFGELPIKWSWDIWGPNS